MQPPCPVRTQVAAATGASLVLAKEGRLVRQTKPGATHQHLTHQKQINQSGGPMRAAYFVVEPAD